MRNLKIRSTRREMAVVGSRVRARRRPILEGLEERRLLTNQMSATSFYVPFVVNQPSGAILVAKVSDAGDLAPLSSHFSANVVWGDGTSSGGAIVPDPVVANEFDVLASHLYTSTGYNQVMVGISNSVTTSTRQVSFNDPVSEPSPVVTAASTPTITIGQTITNLPVATFTDADGGLTASSFGATITWGDGDVSTGTIVADPIISGQFDVTASKPGPYLHAGAEAIGVTVGVAGSQPPNTWASAASIPPLLGPSGQLAAATSGGLLYAIGGNLSGGNATTSAVDSYDPVTNSWIPVVSLPAGRQVLAATTGPDGSIYAIGGINTSGIASTEVDVFGPILNSWTTIAPLPVGRYGFEAATGPDGKIYAIGGFTQGNVPSAEVDAYDPATGAWTTVAPLPTALGQLAATTGPDGRIYAIGGSTGVANSSAVYAYDTSANTWTQVANLPTGIYGLTASTGPDGQLYVVGGANGASYLSTVYSYNVTSNTWTQVASLPTALQSTASATASNGLIYDLGGYNSSAFFATVNSYATFTSSGNASISFTIPKANPVLTWANPADITYGTALSGTQLDATTTIPGTFVYTPAAGTVLTAAAGQTLSVTFTPTDTLDYNSVTQTATINVTPGILTVSWPNPTAITYGTLLGPVQLDATATGSGTFVYSPAAGTLLNAGMSQTLSVTFTAANPSDFTNYTGPVTITTTINVLKVTPTLTWANPSSITYGTAISSTQLDATATIPGMFTYTPAVGTVLGAGNSEVLHVVFIPTDTTDYKTTTATALLTVCKATPTVSWEDPADITYGTALGSVELNATADQPGTFVYTPGYGTVPLAGLGQVLSTTFTPTDSVDYNSVTTTATINVHQATPVITWANPADIPGGTPLSATQLDAMANVPGTFTYTPGIGTILSGGSQVLFVSFTPTDAVDYETATATATINVSKADPIVTWESPADIPYGTPLSSTQLDATASVPGTFVYTPDFGTILNVGAGQTLSVTFTPTDTADYNTVTATTTINVTQATPVITWANPADITYGTTLSGTQLDATASVPGSFVYTPAAGTILGAGVGQTLSVTFTPTDSVDYSTATTTVTINVSPATPVITWSSPADITFGTALSSTQLDATANTPGTFIYAPPAGTILPVGTNLPLVVTFIPTDSTDYTPTTTSTTINVTQATPVITWADPADITYGTALSGTELDATASVPGTFTYAPPLGTVLNAGAGQTLSVTFTPTDTLDYATTTATATLNVLQATPTLEWGNPADIAYGTPLSSTQLNAVASIPGTYTYTPAAGTVMNAGAGQTLSVTFTPTDSVDYTTATTTVTINVTQATPTVTWANPADIGYGTPLGSSQLDATASVPGTFVYTPLAGTILSVGAGQTLSVTFTPTDSVDYASVTTTATINVTIATPVITWPTPADIPFGTALNDLQLDATATIPGVFVYAPPAGTVLPLGSGQILVATFTPTDLVDYNPVTLTNMVNVVKATPVITWANPANITYGTALSGTQLDATVGSSRVDLQACKLEYSIVSPK